MSIIFHTNTKKFLRTDMSRPHTAPDTSRAARKASTQNIAVYGVFHTSAPYKPLYFSATHTEALLAVEKLIFLRHLPHFKLWCSVHTDVSTHQDLLHPSTASPAWKEYLNTAFDANDLDSYDNNYKIVEIKYSKQNLTSFLRLFSHVDPLNLSNETPEECECYIMDNDIVKYKSLSKEKRSGHTLLTAKDLHLNEHLKNLTDAEEDYMNKLVICANACVRVNESDNPEQEAIKIHKEIKNKQT